MIVGLTGYKNVGKDTAAAYLVEKHSFVRFALGDEIYRQVAKAFSVTEDEVRSREWKTTVRPELALRNCKEQEFRQMIVSREVPNIDGQISAFCTEAQTCPRTGTFIVQNWATEYRRGRYGNSYWVDLLVSKLMTQMPGTKVVITDIREEHEVEILEWFSRVYGPMPCGIARIIRPGTAHTGHSSDNGLPQQYIDGYITNMPDDFEGLYSQLDNFLERKMKWMPPKT